MIVQFLKGIALQAHWGMVVSIIVIVGLFLLSMKRPEIVADEGSLASRLTAGLTIFSVAVFAVSFWVTFFAWLPATVRWLLGA